MPGSSQLFNTGYLFGCKPRKSHSFRVIMELASDHSGILSSVWLIDNHQECNQSGLTDLSVLMNERKWQSCASRLIIAKLLWMDIFPWLEVNIRFQWKFRITMSSGNWFWHAPNCLVMEGSVIYTFIRAIHMTGIRVRPCRHSDSWHTHNIFCVKACGMFFVALDLDYAVQHFL